MGTKVWTLSLFSVMAALALGAAASARPPLVEDWQPTQPPSESDEPPDEEAGEAPGQPEPAQTTQPAEQKQAAKPESPSSSPSDAQHHAESASGTDEPTEAEPALRPRLEVFVPSLRNLWAQARASHGGTWGLHLVRLLGWADLAASEGITESQVDALMDEVSGWPDTSLTLVTYAPDLQGRPQWGVRLDWSLEECARRLQAVLALGIASEFLEGVSLTEQPGGYRLDAGVYELAWLRSDESGRAVLLGTPEVSVPQEVWIPGWYQRRASGSESPDPSLLICYRWNLAHTEEDSGALLKRMAFISHTTYQARVEEDGNWRELQQVYWNPLVALGTQMALGRIRHPYELPGDAYLNVAIASPVVGGMLVGMGFPLDEALAHLKEEASVTVLPGEGFFPVPDTVIQLAIRDPEGLVDAIRDKIRQINRELAEDEIEPAWHEERVGKTTVFWHDGRPGRVPAFSAIAWKKVLFVRERKAAANGTRYAVVCALTSTDPLRIARRWHDRTSWASRITLPADAGKTRVSAQIWCNWRRLYDLVRPYLNLSLGSAVGATLLPRTSEIADTLAPSLIHVRQAAREDGVAGLVVRHRGPVPVGALALPLAIMASLEANESGDTDLSRERLACRRLRVLYYHSRLFRRDYGRWPADIAELDGYVDFESHPGLLRIPTSTATRLKQMLRRRESPPSDEHDPWLDTSAYVIEWDEEDWRLGINPDLLDHLDALYIDAEGQIHRVPAEGGASGKDETEAGAADAAWRDRGEPRGSSRPAAQTKQSTRTPKET